MYKGTPYANKHVKKRQQERCMDYHKSNLHQMRPFTGTLDGEVVMINNRKGEMQKETRFTQIQRQNRILLQKISSIMGKTKSKPPQQNPKLNKSLNQSFRRRQHQNIQIENAKLLKRLQEKRPNYETQKLKKQWKKQKYVIKNLSNYPFIISDKRKAKRSTSHISNNQTSNIIQLCRVRVIDGVSFLITVRLNSTRLQIIGDSKDKKEVKVIEIERKEAIQFLEQECEGKIELIFERLRYDREEEVLYLVGTDVDLEELKNEEEEKEKEKVQKVVNEEPTEFHQKEEKQEKKVERKEEKEQEWVKVQEQKKEVKQKQEQKKEQQEQKKEEEQFPNYEEEYQISEPKQNKQKLEENKQINVKEDLNQQKQEVKEKENQNEQQVIQKEDQKEEKENQKEEVEGEEGGEAEVFVQSQKGEQREQNDQKQEKDEENLEAKEEKKEQEKKIVDEI